MRNRYMTSLLALGLVCFGASTSSAQITALGMDADTNTIQAEAAAQMRRRWDLPQRDDQDAKAILEWLKQVLGVRVWRDLNTSQLDRAEYAFRWVVRSRDEEWLRRFVYRLDYSLDYLYESYQRHKMWRGPRWIDFASGAAETSSRSLAAEEGSADEAVPEVATLFETEVSASTEAPSDRTLAPDLYMPQVCPPVCGRRPPVFFFNRVSVDRMLLAGLSRLLFEADRELDRRRIRIGFPMPLAEDEVYAASDAIQPRAATGFSEAEPGTDGGTEVGAVQASDASEFLPGDETVDLGSGGLLEAGDE